MARLERTNPILGEPGLPCDRAYLARLWRNGKKIGCIYSLYRNRKTQPSLSIIQDAPADPAQYGFGTLSTDLKCLLDHLQLPTVTVIGHDWGGLLAWRFTQFYPDRVRAVASFCTPYRPASHVYVPLEDIVKKYPNFTYQLYLTTPEAEREIDTHVIISIKRSERERERQEMGLCIPLSTHTHIYIYI